jgi:hypothetical protein
MAVKIGAADERPTSVGSARRQKWIGDIRRRIFAVGDPPNRRAADARRDNGCRQPDRRPSPAHGQNAPKEISPMRTPRRDNLSIVVLNEGHKRLAANYTNKPEN